MLPNSKTIHEKYHRRTNHSDRIVKKNNFTYRIIINLLDKNIQTSSSILDVGCGAGTICYYLALQGHKVLGIDISRKAITECQKSAKRMGLSSVKFQQSEFPKFNVSMKFDVVIFTEVIEHLPNDKIALKKINSLLKNGGLLILSTPSVNAPLHKLGATKKFDNEVGHLRRYDLRHLRKLIKDVGFRILETKKTEGIFRNFLFVNPYAGKLVRYLNYSGLLSDMATLLDNISLKFFGESNYIIVARKKGGKIKS
jgi:2-polyprenyl-3-methyl-5-hydroxy-6-metoxy-1,4-benzoquinol methylase